MYVNQLEYEENESIESISTEEQLKQSLSPN